MTTTDEKRRRHRNERIVAAIVVIVVALAVVATYRVRRQVEQEVESDLFIPKETKITPEIEWLQQYVRIDTSNPPGNELAGARWLADRLREGGVTAEIIESAPGRANVYARIRGKQPGEALLLMHHIDVVPAKGTWSRPAFAADIRLNMLYGRGVLDMKGIGICQLRAFLDVARSGKTPERDLVLLAVADEETGGTLGTAWLLEHRPDVFEGVRYAINEGGITETRQETISYVGIEIGTKQVVTAELRAATREDLQRTRIALEPWMTFDEPTRILPEVRRFYREIAPQRVEPRPYLEDIDRTISRGEFWRLPRAYRELAQNNVWAETIVERDGAFFLAVHLLNLPDEQPDKRLEWLAEIVRPFGARIERVLVRNGPVPFSSTDTPVYRAIEQVVREQYGPEVPVGTEILATSLNDSRYLRAHGIASYGLWPFPVDYYQTQGIHATDERVRLDWFVSGVELMRKLVSDHAFRPQQKR